jgi:hypothetical protein
VAVLALGCMAIWLVTRSSDQDARLASVLVDEIAGTGPGVFGQAAHDTALKEKPAVHVTSLEHNQAVSPQPEPQEMPF